MHIIIFDIWNVPRASLGLQGLVTGSQMFAQFAGLRENWFCFLLCFNCFPKDHSRMVAPRMSVATVDAQAVPPHTAEQGQASGDTDLESEAAHQFWVTIYYCGLVRMTQNLPRWQGRRALFRGTVPHTAGSQHRHAPLCTFPLLPVPQRWNSRCLYERVPRHCLPPPETCSK